MTRTLEVALTTLVMVTAGLVFVLLIGPRLTLTTPGQHGRTLTHEASR